MSGAQFEWDLLAGSSSSAGPSRTRELATSLVEADFDKVLLSPEAKELLKTRSDLLQDLLSDDSASSSGSSGSTTSTDPEIQLILAIALLHAFVQANWTGPDLSFTPSDLLPSDCADSADIDSRAIPLLTLSGEPAYHLSQFPSLLILSIRLFASLSSSSSPPFTLNWWLLRTHLVHLALLDDPVALPESTLSGIQTLLTQIPEDRQDLRTSLHIELGKYHHALGNDKLANQEFLAGAKASELQYELTGAMGKKTKFQVYAHSQLVLLAESRQREGDEVEADKKEMAEASSSTLPETMALNDDTLLEETEFTKTGPSSSSSSLAHIDPSNQPPLHPLDQTLLLGLCLNVHNSLPSSGLTASQMMPFITRVVTHPRNWSIHTTALLLRSRLEADRSRTVERSTLQLAALIDQMPTSDSAPKERLAFFHQLPLPSRWEMERELAKRYMTVGATRSSLEIFTRLEMWEDAVGCLQRMDREDEAEKIVRDLLEGKKVESDLVSSLAKSTLSTERKAVMGKAREGKLWCLLGDITLGSNNASVDPKGTREAAVGYYEKAWEVSGGTSSRSRRSLGSLLVSGGEYEKAIEVLQAAGAINSLYARVWFTLGVCFTRLERWSEARDAFRRQVSVDEEDGEGWNNLAAVYLRLQDGPADEVTDGDEAETKRSTFDNKLLAFRALRTGLKFSPTNWRMWANYMLISIDVGELAESARAMTRLHSEATAGVPIDIDVLDKLVDSVTRDDWNGGTPAAPIITSNEGFGLLPIVERLFDTIILPRVSDDERIWRCHARLLRWKEDWNGAMEDYLKAYRVGPVSQQSAEREEEKFKEATREVEELVGVLEVLGPKAKEKGRKGDWRFTAKGIVRTFMGRTKDMFEETAEWEKLKELLDELKRPE